MICTPYSSLSKGWSHEVVIFYVRNPPLLILLTLRETYRLFFHATKVLRVEVNKHDTGNPNPVHLHMYIYFSFHLEESFKVILNMYAIQYI